LLSTGDGEGFTIETPMQPAAREARLAVVYDPIYLEHDTGSHPESAERLRHATAALHAAGRFERAALVRPRRAAEAEVQRVHSAEYLADVREACRQGRRRLDPDTAVCPASYEVAMWAAGGALTALEVVMDGRFDRALALVRPPGHHALPARSMGFCLFNNVAVAARHALEVYGLDRILVVDWDFHHGNGTEEIFYEDPRVLFFSIHSRYGYPGTGHADRVGRGEGAGFNINVPLPDSAGDAGCEAAFREVLVPAAGDYRPELVMVSAGQDGYYADPLGGLGLTPAGYARLAGLVREIAEAHCGGRIVAALEGGYHLKGLAETLGVVLDAWM